MIKVGASKMRVLFFLLLAVNVCLFLGSWGEYRVRTGQQIGAYSSELEVLHTLKERSAGLPPQQYVPVGVVLPPHDEGDEPTVTVASRVQQAEPLVVEAHAAEGSSLVVPNPLVENSGAESSATAVEPENVVAERAATPDDAALPPIAETLPLESPLEPPEAASVVAESSASDIIGVSAVTELEVSSVAAPDLDITPVDAPDVQSQPAAGNASVATSLAGGCMLVGPFADVDAALAIARKLESFGHTVQYHQSEQAAVASGYNVLLPPASSLTAARQLLARLQAAGVRDHYVIDDGPNKFGVMLGFYREQRFADERMRRVTAAGFKPLLKPRRQSSESYWLEYSLLPGETALPAGVGPLNGASSKVQACS